MKILKNKWTWIVVSVVAVGAILWYGNGRWFSVGMSDKGK